MKTKPFTQLIAISLLICSVISARAVSVPAGIKHDGYDRLLKKYVNDRGLVAYEKWKASAEDRKAIDDYVAQFAPAGAAATGNERFASLINAYNAFVLQWIVQNYPTESIWALKGSFKEKRYKLGGTMVSLNDIENDNLRVRARRA